MSGIRHIAVVIPARDEHELIELCLRSLLIANRKLQKTHTDEVTVSIVVVADGCTDDTAELARRFPVTVLEVPQIGVGAARALGVASQLRATAAPSEQLWLANTDADSAVDPNWLLEQVRCAAAGNDVRIGGVRPRSSDLTPKQMRRWRATHSNGEARTHIHGANLGIRASSYLDAGGFRPLLEHEDVDLVDRLIACAAIVAYPGVSDVVTSGRTFGRTPGGYAEYLRLDELAADSLTG